MDIIALAALIAARSRGLTVREVASLAGIDPREARRLEIGTLGRVTITANKPEARADAMRAAVTRFGRAFAGCSLAI